MVTFRIIRHESAMKRQLRIPADVRHNGMETLRVIRNILPGVALGQDSQGNSFYIMNGDLYLDKVCEVEINGKSATLKELNYDIFSLIQIYGDNDGLVETCKLEEAKFSKPFDRIFKIEDKFCFPSYPIKKLIEIIISKNLWTSTRIAISKTRFKSITRATVFGIDFRKAIIKAIKEGISVTHLYWSDFKEWTDQGVFADFLIKITKSKEGLIELNSWQAVGSERTLFFVHGIFDESHKNFIHLDFAYHHTSIDEIQKLLLSGKDKPVLTKKEKILRLDGEIDTDIGFELMRIFFPIDNLVDEYYYCS